MLVFKRKKMKTGKEIENQVEGKKYGRNGASRYLHIHEKNNRKEERKIRKRRRVGDSARQRKVWEKKK